MLKSSIRRSVGAGALAVLMLAGPAVAQDKVRFQTDWIPSGEHAMYYGGWSKGIFAKHGIDITITRGYGSGDTVTKLAGGAADFGVADIAAVFTARARTNVPVKTIAVALQRVAAFAVRAEELGHHQLQGAGRQEDRHHAGQQPPVLFPRGRRAGRHRSQQDHLDQHGRRGDGGPAHRQEHRRRAVLFDPLLLHQQGGGEGGRGDPAAAVRRGRLQDLRRVAHHHRQDDRGEARPGEALPGGRARRPSSGRAPIPRRPASCTSQRFPEVALDDCMGSVQGGHDLRLQRPQQAVRLGQGERRSG